MAAGPDPGPQLPEHNLLFGVLALQGDFIQKTQFVEACAAWAARKDTPLLDILMERNWLTPDDRAAVNRMLEKKLLKGQGAVQHSLRQSLGGEVLKDLKGVGDVTIDDVLGDAPDAPAGAGVSADLAVEHLRQRYQLLGSPKKGGIGQVWRARDEHLGREVALKELQPDVALSALARNRFLAEAQVTAQLAHPNFVPIYELIQPAAERDSFYTMQYIEGRTLTAAAKEYHDQRAAGQTSPLALRELLAAFLAVCNAVAHAHSRGVLHRDLKGGNVVLGAHGEVFLVDWGMAKVCGQAEDAAAAPVELATTPPGLETRQGQLLGTPAYMAPEQAAGRRSRGPIPARYSGKCRRGRWRLQVGSVRGCRGPWKRFASRPWPAGGRSATPRRASWPGRWSAGWPTGRSGPGANPSP
jgi:tRNA A-37 threonylcarbamoyl transferase component Bud32